MPLTLRSIANKKQLTTKQLSRFLPQDLSSSLHERYKATGTILNLQYWVSYFLSHF